jgi:hypothetical protein
MSPPLVEMKADETPVLAHQIALAVGLDFEGDSASGRVLIERKRTRTVVRF